MNSKSIYFVCFIVITSFFFTNQTSIESLKLGNENNLGTNKLNLLETGTSKLYSQAVPDSKCITDYHLPFGSTETFDMKGNSIISIIVFSGSLVTFLLFISLIKKSSNSFFVKAFSYLTNETSYLIWTLVILSLLYLLKALDKIPVNWQPIIAGLFIFVFAFLICGTVIILLAYLVSHKWKELEKNSKNFKHTRAKYEKHCKITPNDENNSSNLNGNPSVFFELFEFLIMKTYFIVPFFPVFKPSVLNTNFGMSRYLKFCLLEKLKMLFRFSWTALVLSLILILSWNVLITELPFNGQLIFMMCYPLIGLLTLMILYLYFKVIYRRSVVAVTDENYSDFKDLEEFNQNYATEKFLNYPVYLENIINNPEEAKIAKINFHSHFHGRTSSFYEDTIAFGASGYYLFFNIFQTIYIVFIIWLTYASLILIPQMWVAAYSTAPKVLCIISLVTYAFLHSYFIAITLRWYTVISSIEMKKNEECLKESIEEEVSESSELSESIFKSFKRLYFDMKLKCRESNPERESEKFNNLNKPFLRKLLISVILRFKSINNLEELSNKNDQDQEDLLRSSHKELSVDVFNELKLFLKTAGNNLTDDDIDFMLHMIENFDKYNETKRLTQSQLFEIWAVMIHFSNLRPEDIVEFVFQQYFKERIELLSTNKISEEGVIEFLKWYQEYFTQSQVDFLEKEAQVLFNLKKEVSIDYFIHYVLSIRGHYRN